MSLLLCVPLLLVVSGTDGGAPAGLATPTGGGGGSARPSPAPALSPEDLELARELELLESLGEAQNLELLDLLGDSVETGRD